MTVLLMAIAGHSVESFKILPISFAAVLICDRSISSFRRGVPTVMKIILQLLYQIIKVTGHCKIFPNLFF